LNTPRLTALLPPWYFYGRSIHARFSGLTGKVNVGADILLAISGSALDRQHRFSGAVGVDHRRHRLIDAKKPARGFIKSDTTHDLHVFFFSGAPYLSIAQMAAGQYTYPLSVSLLAAPLLGEVVGRWRLTALAIGAVGAGLLLSPWDDGFSAVQLLPIMAGFFYATNILMLRRACRNESPLALAFMVGIVFLISGLLGIGLLSAFPLAQDIRESMPFVAIGWPELTLAVAGFALLASVLNLTGNICMSRAYQTADASLLAPLDFSYLVFAAIWGRLLFDTWPSRQALAGMALIACAGVITAWREQLTASRSRKFRGPNI